MTKTNTLPDKPSELINVALADLAKVEQSKKYEVDMDTWHDPSAGICYVCLAGAVMAKSLQASPDKSLLPSMHNGGLSGKLSALDEFRTGDVSWGFSDMGIDVEEDVLNFDRDINDYEDDPKAFKRDMRKLSKDLAKAGF